VKMRYVERCFLLVFVGRRCDRPAPSFHVGRDVYAGYFIAVRSADGDLRPF
jgi:hypothetical protein